MSHGITLAKHKVKQGEVIFFPSDKKIWMTPLHWKLVEEYKDEIINLN